MPINIFMKQYVEYQFKNQIKDHNWDYVQHPIMNLADKLQPHFDYLQENIKNKTLVPEYIPVFGDDTWVEKVSSSTNGDVSKEEFKKWIFDFEYPDLIKNHGHKFLRNLGDHKDEIVEIFSEALGLDKSTMIVRVQIEEPGHFYPVHLDRYTLQTNHNPDPNEVYDVEADNKRNMIYVIFFNDQKRGQMIQMGDNFLKWKSGDVIGFNLRNVPHCTCNVGYEPNLMFIITTPALYG